MMSKLPKEKPVRLFFALWPKEPESAALAVWQPVLQTVVGGKAMRVETLHNTLVFLGDVMPHRLEALLLAAQEVRGHPFDLHIDMARYWGHNHIVFAAPSHLPAALGRLVTALEQRLRHHRFHFDQRDYQAHITLLRHAKWNDAPLPPVPPVVWQVQDFALMQSVSDGNGARYLVLARFPLARS